MAIEKITANRACAILYSYIKTYSKGKYLIPVNVCPDIPLTFLAADIPFEFIDIDPNTLCISIKECCDKIAKCKDDYQGIVYVRTYGCLDDVSIEFQHLHSIAPNIKIIDDRCLCIPEQNPDIMEADIVLYSTGRGKQIELGYGGFACCISLDFQLKLHELDYYGTDEETLYKEAYTKKEPLRNLPKGWLLIDDLNYDTNDYYSKIDSLIPTRNYIRDSINKVYSSLLPNEIQMKEQYQQWRFNIVVPTEKKELIINSLFANNLFASSHYHSANRLFDFNKFPKSDFLQDHVINLFNDYHYSVEKAVETCRIINKILL